MYLIELISGRLKAKDELIAELVEALAEALYTIYVMEENLTPAWNKQSDATKQIWRDKAIRKHKGE